MNDAGDTLNSKIDINSRDIVLHSRSGTTRNRDYRSALELILTRLDGAHITYEIYLDSEPVQAAPLFERELSFDRAAQVEQRFDELVRAMNAGTQSHGAWRRLLITTDLHDSNKLVAILRAVNEEGTIARLPASELRKVTTEHIHRAVEKLLNGEDAANFSASRDYDVLTDDGVRLAPKKVFGKAMEEALGIEALPVHFSAGWGTICFNLLEEAGLWIVTKVVSADRRPRSKPREVVEGIAQIIATEEEKAWIEGNPKIVQHLVRERQHGLAKLKREEFIAEHGRLFCEDCRLDPVEQYGDAGTACIEVHHHRTHVSKMHQGHRSFTDDLKCLCANCHRVLHRKLTLGLGSL
ncbi:hypothetical protein [Neorhizobium sp. AL 9.2.2]|uniref:HNH endonuclease n=1 Tax=Neorhizobium sp. AL 9.2.2 TaxID=2712894 RepID=UPI001572BA3B|nr:hypothetical protein [Neorhizobium sp. AL 9.2.2]NSY16156.1 hypothetical protein [Neorhizobium sp. AL 9.2.2]